jgi:hypothetical protein
VTVGDKPVPPPLPTPVVAYLQRDDRVERCPTDLLYARRQLVRIAANECEDALHAAAQGRWPKANTYSYDGARKAVEAMLLSHGWRVRNMPGAHLAVVEVVMNWLGDTPPPGPRIARQFAAARTARHDDEYPAPTARPRTDRELRALAQDNVRLVNAVREQLDLSVLKTLVPTDANLAQRAEQTP